MHCYAETLEVSQFITCENNGDYPGSLREQLRISDWIYTEQLRTYKGGWMEREEQIPPQIPDF